MAEDARVKNRISMLALSCMFTVVSIYNLNCVPESTVVIKGSIAKVETVGRVRAKVSLQGDDTQYITRRGYSQGVVRSRLGAAEGNQTVELTVDSQDFGTKRQVLALSADGVEIIALDDTMKQLKRVRRSALVVLAICIPVDIWLIAVLGKRRAINSVRG